MDTRQKTRENFVGAAIGIFDRYNAISWLEQRIKRIADRRHPGRKTGRGFCTFQLAHFFFKYRHSWIRIATVNMAFFLPQSNIVPVVQIIITITDTVHNRNLRRTLPTLFFLFAAPNRQCVIARFILIGHNMLLVIDFFIDFVYPLSIEVPHAIFRNSPAPQGPAYCVLY